MKFEVRIALMRVALTKKSHFDVKKTYASIRHLVVKTIALGKTRTSAIDFEALIGRRST